MDPQFRKQFRVKVEAGRMTNVDDRDDDILLKQRGTFGHEGLTYF